MGAASLDYLCLPVADGELLHLCVSMLPSLCAEDLNKANTKTRFSKLQWEGKKPGDARKCRSRNVAFRVLFYFVFALVPA